MAYTKYIHQTCICSRRSNYSKPSLFMRHLRVRLKCAQTRKLCDCTKKNLASNMSKIIRALVIVIHTIHRKSLWILSNHHKKKHILFSTKRKIWNAQNQFQLEQKGIHTLALQWFSFIHMLAGGLVLKDAKLLTWSIIEFIFLAHQHQLTITLFFI